MIDRQSDRLVSGWIVAVLSATTTTTNQKHRLPCAQQFGPRQIDRRLALLRRFVPNVQVDAIGRGAGKSAETLSLTTASQQRIITVNFGVSLLKQRNPKLEKF